MDLLRSTLILWALGANLARIVSHKVLLELVPLTAVEVPLTRRST